MEPLWRTGLSGSTLQSGGTTVTVAVGGAAAVEAEAAHEGEVGVGEGMTNGEVEEGMTTEEITMQITTEVL